MSTNDDLPSRRAEERVPLSEARAEIEFEGRDAEAFVSNLSSAGLSFWISDDLGLEVNSVATVKFAGEQFSFQIKWIDRDPTRGFTIGGDRLHSG